MRHYAINLNIFIWFEILFVFLNVFIFNFEIC